MPKKPLKLRELTKKLRDYGIKVLANRGKGSERRYVEHDT